MRKTAKEYFTRPTIELSTDAEGNPIVFRELIAVIVLFSASAHIDGVFNDNELRVILDLIVDEFNVSEEHAVELYEIAEYLLMDHKNINKYIEVINTCYNEKQRRKILNLVMKITSIDGAPVEQEGILRSKIRSLFKLEKFV